MSITAERKTELIKEYARGDKDTGSPEIQVAILSERIKNLTEHLKALPFRTWADDHGRPAPPPPRLSEA